MSDDLISAGELRQIGLAVPENIPDCATVPRRSIKQEVGECSVGESKDTICVDIIYRFTEPFKWITVNALVTKDGSGASS